MSSQKKEILLQQKLQWCVAWQKSENNNSAQTKTYGPKVLTETPTPTDINLLKWQAIRPKQLRQHMDSWIVLGASDLHHTKMFASKWSSLWFYTSSQCLLDVTVLFERQTKKINFINHLLKFWVSIEKHRACTYHFKLKIKLLQTRWMLKQEK